MSDIQPALTPEQWTALEFQFEYWGRAHLHADGNLEVRDKVNHPALLKGVERHKLAALCLYGQPFGFTAEDVMWLNGIASDPFLPHDGHAASIRDRIAALLPP